MIQFILFIRTHLFLFLVAFALHLLPFFYKKMLKIIYKKIRNKRKINTADER